MSAFGPKRTSALALHMSALDPKRTLGSQSARLYLLHKAWSSRGQMQRRRFITLLGSAAAIWPLTARAQQTERVRRIGALSALAEDDPESLARRPAFEQALRALGWTNGSNLRVDYRWGADDA